MAQACNPSTFGGWGGWITRSRDRDHPGQHGETPSLLKIQKISWAWWCMHVIPATQEAKAEEYPELRRQRLWWSKIAPLYSSLGNKSETVSKKKERKKEKKGRKEGKKERNPWGGGHHLQMKLRYRKGEFLAQALPAEWWYLDSGSLVWEQVSSHSSVGSLFQAGLFQAELFSLFVLQRRLYMLAWHLHILKSLCVFPS